MAKKKLPSSKKKFSKNTKRTNKNKHTKTNNHRTKGVKKHAKSQNKNVNPQIFKPNGIKKKQNDHITPPPPKNQQIDPEEMSEESDIGENMLDMVENEDLAFLKSAITQRSYSIFDGINYSKTKTKKRKSEDNDDTMETQYAEQNDFVPVKVKRLLPIKTKEGVITREIVKTVDEDEDKENIDEDETEFSLDQDDEDEDKTKPITALKLLIQRNKILKEKKLEIGVLSAGVLENPQEKISNVGLLLKIMDEQIPEIYITVRKLCIISLLEIFKDILPSYQIKFVDDEAVTLKKATLALRKFEKDLLQYYKRFLQKIEKGCLVLSKHKGNTKLISEEGKKLGELSLKAMCDLLVAHPYFNYSENIAQVLVPFLNHTELSYRLIVKAAIVNVFREDKKEEITLKIMKILNHYLKKHTHNVRKEMLEVLLVLNLSNVNLDQNKVQDMKMKKLKSHKGNILALSKNEKRRQKKLKELEQELLETKAEESKQTKLKNLTEITKILFGIYFRIIKSSENNEIVGVCLQGLAKYSHHINLEFYVDIVNAIDRLLKEDWLGCREQLHCIQTVFAILSGQGEALNIDPLRFYNNIYKNIFQIDAVNNHEYHAIVLKILKDCLIKRRKKITDKRTAGFVKRLAISSLYLLHHGTLGNLGIIRNLMQLNKTLDILLDRENSLGEGKYNPDLDDSEYSNAASSALYEMIILHRHYHPMVSKFAKNIIFGVPPSGEGSMSFDVGKLAPEELFEAYSMDEMAFNPPVPPPTSKQTAKFRPRIGFADLEFEKYCRLSCKASLDKIFCT